MAGDYISIKELLDSEGSDKGTWYCGLYDVLLQPHRFTTRSVLEIGIGTLIPNAISSMVGYAASHYRPGGSLRVWRAFFPQASIHGIDVAADTQFEKTAFTPISVTRGMLHRLLPSRRKSRISRPTSLLTTDCMMLSPR